MALRDTSNRANQRKKSNYDDAILQKRYLQHQKIINELRNEHNEMMVKHLIFDPLAPEKGGTICFSCGPTTSGYFSAKRPNINLRKSS